MTKPVEGGKVKFFPPDSEGVSIDALITKAWSDTCVNVEWMEGDQVRSATSVLVYVPGGERPSGYYCELVDVETITSGDVGDLGALLSAGASPDVAALNAGEVSAETLEALGVKVEQPPADDDHVAPGCRLFSDSSRFKGIRLLDRVRALPRVEFDSGAMLFETIDPLEIQFFKSEDGETMAVVHVAGGLAAMPLPQRPAVDD